MSFQNILSLIEEASSLVDPFSSTSSEELSSLYESDLSIETESSLQDTEKSLSNMEFSKYAQLEFNFNR
ncbi:MAG: hypothetical protein CM15mP111_0050 [Hyphomicrobiales bacterium]|nr:MAG: hypothetical protein CM15mP111_0050 [Hyphomicrobiales bacterium]